MREQMISSTESERRSSDRVPVDLGATLHKDSVFHTCRIGDVSEGGVLVTASGCALEAGRPVAVAFPIDGEVIMVRGDVRWVRGADAGVQFSYMSPFDRAMIKAFCRKRKSLVAA
jgi:PilZ domain